MPEKHSITLYEVENRGRYHEHWLTSSPLDAARRAFSHAEECGLALNHVDVSSMVRPEDVRKGGLVYVVNDTRTYVIERGRARRADPPDESCTLPSRPAKPKLSHPAIRRIHDLLYLDIQNGREFYDPDKSWDADTMAMIAEIVAEFTPRPKPISSDKT